MFKKYRIEVLLILFHSDILAEHHNVTLFFYKIIIFSNINPLNTELNPICQ